MVNQTHGDIISFDAVSASTPPFRVRGGLYKFEVVGDFGADAEVRLNQLLPDGVTWHNEGFATISASPGVDEIHLAPGTCRVFVGGTPGAAGIDIRLARIPLGD